MPRLVPLLVAPVLLLVQAGAQATTTWLCGLNDELVQLVCVADVDPVALIEAPRTVAVVNGTAFPLDPRRTYTVNLWTPPSEPEWVEHLARATICYRTAGCEVVMAPLPIGRRPTFRR